MDTLSWFWLSTVVISVLYGALIVWFLIGWKNISPFKSANKSFSTTVVVILPFYNEALSLKQCVDNLLAQNIKTKEYDIVLVDDSSIDDSYAIAKNIAKNNNRIKLLKNEFAKGKKGALETAIKNSESELIVTTDADVQVNENWLSTIVDYYEQEKPEMIIAPVEFAPVKGLFQLFQYFDFVSLVATGAGAAGINRPIMCNGANLAYTRKSYSAIDDAFNKKYISGDDVFLLHNFKKKNAEGIHFLKSREALATTHPAKGLQSFMKQRKRWASKTTGYIDADAKFTAIVVFFIAILSVFGMLASLININFLWPTLLLFGVKILFDLLFFYGMSDFFKLKNRLKYLPLFQLVYVFYVTVVGLLSFIPSRKW